MNENKTLEGNSSSLRGKRVLIFQQRGWGLHVGSFLARRLQDEGCRLAALTKKRTVHNFILEQKEVKYDLIVSHDEIIGKPKKFLQGEAVSLAEICADLGIDSIWPLVATERRGVKSYRDKYYYGFKQNVSDEKLIDLVRAIYKNIRFIFNEFKPDIILAPNFSNMVHIMFNLFAKKRGVEMITVVGARVKSAFIFAHDYRESTGDFYSRVDDLNAGKIDSPNREKSRKYIEEFRESFKKPDYTIAIEQKLNAKKSLKDMIRHELAPYYHILRWYLGIESVNLIESLGITADYRPPRIILRDHHCQKKYKKFMDNFKYYQLEKIGKYVYFPLQFQPEATIDVTAPYFSNQIEVIRQLAMSLPGDYTLVVKEHPAMADKRPPSYIEKIDRTPNVKLIDYRIPNEAVMKGADLLISPNGTTLVESAFYRKPAIQLGDLGTTLKLPNVFKHTDMTTIAVKIKEILKIDLNNAEYERRLENYVAAAYDTGFEFNYWGVWQRGEQADMELLWHVWKNEISKSIFKE